MRHIAVGYHARWRRNHLQGLVHGQPRHHHNRPQHRATRFPLAGTEQQQTNKTTFTSRFGVNVKKIIAAGHSLQVFGGDGVDALAN